MEPLIQAWEISARINAYFIESLTPEQWGAKAAKGRSVEAQFAHLHNVRLMWLKSAAPDLLEGLTKLEPPCSQEDALAGLRASAEAISQLLTQAGSPDGRVKGFKPHAGAFVGYLISHESHHRGQAELILRLTGMPVSDKVSFGLWEWGVR